jgi:FHA domain-containing protein
MRLVSCVMAAALLVVARPVRAEDDAAKAANFATIDHVDYEPSSIGANRLVIALSALELRGNIIPDIKPKVVVGGSTLDAPYAFGSYGATVADRAIVVVIQATVEYADALPAIVATLDQEVLGAIGERTQVAIFSYGDAAGNGKLGTVKAARNRLAQIAPDASPTDPALLDTVDRALTLLRRAKAPVEGAPLRKMIVLISDGRDRSGDRDRVTRLGQRADKEGVRIHSFAYAPSKIRRPLLLLGELSKRSLGTFRFLFSGAAESWTPAFHQLRDEITKQYVLTYFVPVDDDLTGKKVKVVIGGRVDATSQNEPKVPALACNGSPCAGYCTDTACVVPHASTGRGAFGWVLVLGGLAVGAIVVLGLIGYLLSKRSQPIALPPGFVPPPGFVMPGTKPPKAKPSRPPKHAPVVAAPLPPPPSGPSLMFIAGPRAGQRVYLRHGFLIGKAPTSDLVIDDGYTSTQHAQIALDASGNCNLYDRNSTNGTYVNGVRVAQALLAHGHSVRFGSTELQYLAQ